MYIDKTNYFEASRGHFKVQPVSWAWTAFEAVGPWEYKDPKGVSMARVYNAQQKIKLGNHVWLPNFVSYSPKFNSLSCYWISEDEKHLLRLSDHWSESNIRKVNTIGNIRYCWWSLEGRFQPSVQGMHLGLISFSEMTSL